MEAGCEVGVLQGIISWGEAVFLGDWDGFLRSPTRGMGADRRTMTAPFSGSAPPLRQIVQIARSHRTGENAREPTNLLFRRFRIARGRESGQEDQRGCTMRRFTILGLMGLVLGVAIAVAALRNADDYWAGGLILATAHLIGVVTLGAVYHTGRRRAGRLGFAVFTGGYFALAFLGLSDQNLAKLPTTWLLVYVHQRVAAPQTFTVTLTERRAGQYGSDEQCHPRSVGQHDHDDHNVAVRRGEHVDRQHVHALADIAARCGQLRGLQRGWALPVCPAGWSAGDGHRAEVPAEAGAIGGVRSGRGGMKRISMWIS